MTLTIVIGVAGYLLAGWSLIDSVFMVIITIFGVGYGEVREESPELRMFTMMVILSGCTSLVYLLGGFVQSLTEGEIQRLISKRRMKAEIENLENHIIICGLGRIGRMLVEDLLKAGKAFVVVDSNASRIEDFDRAGCLICEGDATDEAVLQKAGIERARILATVLPNDAANVFITLSARNLNSEIEIIARGEIPSTEPKLIQAGASRVVLPAHIGAERIAHQILHPSTANLLANNHALRELDTQLSSVGIQITEMDIPEGSSLVGTNLSQVETQSKAQFLVIAIHRKDGTQLLHPTPETKIETDDRMIFLCHSEDVPDFTRNYQMIKKRQYRGQTF